MCGKETQQNSLVPIKNDGLKPASCIIEAGIHLLNWFQIISVLLTIIIIIMEKWLTLQQTNFNKDSTK